MKLIEYYLIQLKQKGVLEFDRIKSVAAYTEYSNNNYLWRAVLTTNGRKKIIFIKQARAWNRRFWEERREKIFVDPRRIESEYQMINLLGRLWGNALVPKIYYFGSKQHILILSDVSKGKVLLVDEFTHDRIHPELGRVFGTLFGVLHAETYNKEAVFEPAPRWYKKMQDFFEGPDLLAYGVRNTFSARTVQAFFNEVHSAKKSMIWGDVVDRNIFVSRRGGNVAMVDFDHAQLYDPAVDCGMLLAHWLWMGLKTEKINMQSKKFCRNFWQSYKKEFQARKLDAEVVGIRKRSDRWAGLYLISRVVRHHHLKSYFAQWPEWEQKILEKGKALFFKTVS